MVRILCAAIWFKERKKPEHTVRNPGMQGAVWQGRRHHDIISLFYTETGIGLAGCGAYEQGFVTTDNYFVDRSEAACIAFEAGQIKERKGKLYSEDLY